MPELFALQGPGNCGKTTTLKNLYNAVCSKYPAATVQILHRGTADVAIIVRGVNGLDIGIESQGDPNSRLQNTLSTFVGEKCDIIFCACRTRGMTVDWVNALSSQYNIHFVQQNQVAKNYAAINSAMAASLMQQAGI
ncbi:hypothetical protein [uncultured Pseudoteredinibacter sp.]|uniref:hypothetical protein n=1 Tax=uncultured Pseudoteredinibacter sp. TaxID=1641701 RepID=UPI0026219A64|nr:hypothetical protein [uncultured Pseudoteredinibacter sp.]